MPAITELRGAICLPQKELFFNRVLLNDQLHHSNQFVLLGSYLLYTIVTFTALVCSLHSPLFGTHAPFAEGPAYCEK